MRDLESVRRSFLRKSGVYSGRSSWPFLSGDTFREMCEIRVDTKSDVEKIFSLEEYSGNIFVRAEVADYLISELSSSRHLDFSNVNFVIHNGDHIPDKYELVKFASQVKHVYCVNWLGSSPNISPIPIGLENWSYLQNGVPKDFSNLVDLPRDINLLVGFSNYTNLVERSEARAFAAEVSDVYFVPEGTSPRKYRELVRRSRFVLSPPGNGPDCHRTWESIYLGAIPIVKEEFWPFLNFQLPVLLVSQWSEIPSAVKKPIIHPRINVVELGGLFTGGLLND